MKTLRPGTISLMLSIILWGTLLGGIAYSHLIYFPVYLSALPDSAVVVKRVANRFNYDNLYY